MELFSGGSHRYQAVDVTIPIDQKLRMEQQPAEVSYRRYPHKVQWRRCR
jgi:hypothetical protein